MATGSYERKQYVGGAPATTLNGAVSDVATSLVIADASGWPDATNPFVVVVNRGQPTEEKILVTARSTTTLTLGTRGYDDTTAQSHANGATIEHTLDASSVDQANRLANLMLAKGDVIVHNGTNPTRVAANQVDGYTLNVDIAEGTGTKWSRPIHIEHEASAPTVTAVPRLWFDENTGVIRTSDGSTWLVPSSIPLFATTGARDTYYGATPVRSGVACIVGTTPNTQAQVWDGTIWQRIPRLDEAIPKFADATARDAYYTTPVSGDHAFLSDVHQLTEYREDEWILLNRKFTTDAVAPTSPHLGDIWIQPTA